MSVNIKFYHWHSKNVIKSIHCIWKLIEYCEITYHDILRYLYFFTFLISCIKDRDEIPKYEGRGFWCLTFNTCETWTNAVTLLLYTDTLGIQPKKVFFGFHKSKNKRFVSQRFIFLCFYFHFHVELCWFRKNKWVMCTKFFVCGDLEIETLMDRSQTKTLSFKPSSANPYFQLLTLL